jgi:hypothetical protein
LQIQNKVLIRARVCDKLHVLYWPIKAANLALVVCSIEQALPLSEMNSNCADDNHAKPEE